MSASSQSFQQSLLGGRQYVVTLDIKTWPLE